MIIDLHCHILPHVDDGSKDMDMTKEMLQEAVDEGVRAIVATPHYYAQMRESEHKKRWEAYLEVVELLKQSYPGLMLFYGAEVYFESIVVEELEKRIVPTINGTDYLLVEFRPSVDFLYIKQAFWQIKGLGYKPILAHVERYSCIKESEQLEELNREGVLIQSNCDAIVGKHGWLTKRKLAKWLKEGYIHLIGSDAHNIDSRKIMGKTCEDYLKRLLGEEAAKKICYTNARTVLKGEKVL